MGCGGSKAIGPDIDLYKMLSGLRENDPEEFDKTLALVKYQASEARPAFPKGKVVASVPTVPEAELEAFKAAHIDNSYIHDYDSPEAKERMGSIPKVRDAQYKRWKWACDNLDTFINVLRQSSHSDEAIQGMLEGRPLCFADKATYDALVASLAALAPALEKELGWENVGFIFTGSSVPGFSQNPLKGKHYEPTKITSPTKSDVDICIKADGVGPFLEACNQKGVKYRGYPTTCSATTGGMRYGLRDYAQYESAAMAAFLAEWTPKLKGGLQLTMCEDSLDMPPWEARIPISGK